MRKLIVLTLCMLLAASWAMAQESANPADAPRLTAFEGDIAFGYRWVLHDGNLFAGEYEYPHSSLAGEANIEYDPLPNRLLFEAWVNNEKDYHTELDYSYADIVMFNFIGRKFYRNMHHLELAPSAPQSDATDKDPNAHYFSDSAVNFARLRLKAPEFPVHLYVEGRSHEKHGTIQQRFMRSFTAGDRVSQSRNIDYETNEVKVTMNSHVRFVEVEFSHAMKDFANTQAKSLVDVTDVTNVAYTHNQVSDTESSTSTVKVHTSHTGRIAAAATYSSGERENKDSLVKADFANAGLDFTWIPNKDTTVSLKYRHDEVSQDGPATVDTITSLGTTTTYSVRDALSTTRDIVSGYVRYRATDKLTLRAELAQDQWTRDFNATDWTLDKEITRLTMRLGATYYVHRRFVLRGDVTHQTADVPSNSVDNTYSDTVDTVRGSAIWSPASWFSMVLSGATTMEKRDEQAFPFTGPRETTRNRAQGSFTFLIGKNTAITPSYAYFQNRTTTPIAYTDIASGITVEDGVPYADTAHIASIAVSHALTDVVTVSADATRSWSRGSWQNAGVVTGSDGITAYSNLNIIESELGADVELHYNKNVGSDLRYRYRTVDDRLDDAEDGTYQTILAMLTVVW